MIRAAGALLVAFSLLLVAGPAAANPAFARKYGTSCTTCHVVYPKLNPFGEAFRRNGFRFPGIDSDVVKQETVALGQEAYKKTFPYSVWPGTLPVSVPIAVGFNGSIGMHPDVHSSAGQADNGTAISVQDLIGEGHIWAGGAFDDTITYYGEMTFSKDGVELEHAIVVFNDLFFGPHALNLRVGKTIAGVTSFGQHSSYVGDALLAPLAVTALYGSATDAWNLVDSYPGIELNGVVGGRFDYSAGFNAGANMDVRNSQSVYAHIGTKIGGLRLDGEGGGGGGDPMKPWAENALTLDTFVYRTASRFADLNNKNRDDTALAFGAHLRGQLGSLELNSGIYQERHTHANALGQGINGLTQYNELSYVVFPWLVPGVRFEYSRLSPTIANATAIHDFRVSPGVAALVRPNLKLTLVGQLEQAYGAPDGGWGAAGGSAAPSGKSQTVNVELESINLGLAFAF
jgi:thiol-disulfide isomerase/thioredoxin